MKNARQVSLLIFGVAYFCFMQAVTEENSPMFPGVVSAISLIALMVPERKDEQ